MMSAIIERFDFVVFVKFLSKNPKFAMQNNKNENESIDGEIVEAFIDNSNHPGLAVKNFKNINRFGQEYSTANF